MGSNMWDDRILFERAALTYFVDGSGCRSFVIRLTPSGSDVSREGSSSFKLCLERLNWSSDPWVFCDDVAASLGAVDGSLCSEGLGSSICFGPCKLVDCVSCFGGCSNVSNSTWIVWSMEWYLFSCLERTFQRFRFSVCVILGIVSNLSSKMMWYCLRTDMISVWIVMVFRPA